MSVKDAINEGILNNELGYDGVPEEVYAVVTFKDGTSERWDDVSLISHQQQIDRLGAPSGESFHKLSEVEAKQIVDIEIRFVHKVFGLAAEPKAGDGMTGGHIVKETDRIMDGLVQVMFEDGTERVWISPKRQAYAPDDVSIDVDNCAGIDDLDTILDWYDIEWCPHDAFTGEYHYKEILREACPEQASLSVTRKDGQEERWPVVVSESGLIQSVTTDDGDELENLAELRAALRAVGATEVELVSEYGIQNY